MHIFIIKFVSSRDRDVKLREVAEHSLGAAIYYQVFGATERAGTFAEQAARLSPSLRKDVERLLQFQ